MKREGQKMRLFALKEILERETDDKHSITMDRILQLLQTEYQIKGERKSIYDDMRDFRESEMLDVTPPQGRERGYSVASMKSPKWQVDVDENSLKRVHQKINSMLDSIFGKR